MRLSMKKGISFVVLGLELCLGKVILFFGGHTVENVDAEMRGVVLAVNGAFWIGIGLASVGLVVLGAAAVSWFQENRRLSSPTTQKR